MNIEKCQISILYKSEFNFNKSCDNITVPDFKRLPVLHVARPPHLDDVDVSQAEEQGWQHAL